MLSMDEALCIPLWVNSYKKSNLPIIDSPDLGIFLFV